LQLGAYVATEVRSQSGHRRHAALGKALVFGSNRAELAGAPAESRHTAGIRAGASCDHFRAHRTGGVPRWCQSAGSRFALFCSPAPAAAQCPERPIRVIVSYPPGGGTDATARVVVPRLSELLGRQILIDNRPGAALRSAPISWRRRRRHRQQPQRVRGVHLQRDRQVDPGGEGRRNQGGI